MELNKLIKLKRKLKNTKQLLKIRMIIEYFGLAKSLYEIYNEYLQKWIDQDQEELKTKSIAAVYGLYSSGRVCLFVARDINKQINNEYKNWAIRFIDFRNDFGAHPLNKEIGCYSHVAGFGNQRPKLIVEVRDAETYKINRSYEVNPKEDIEKLYNYLEDLAEIYEKECAKI